MSNCKVCSKEISDGDYYCGFDCYAKVVPATRLLVGFAAAQQQKEKRMDTNKTAKYIKIGGAVFCAVVFILAMVMLVRPAVSSGPTIDQQNEVNHVK